LLVLILAAVGLVGATAHCVARRMHEIGIRMALGAQRRNVLAPVLKQAASVAIVGAIVG